jgi:hypothetical protein
MGGGYNNVENAVNEQCRKCPNKNSVAKLNKLKTLKSIKLNNRIDFF